jgi:hypothetical protein
MEVGENTRKILRCIIAARDLAYALQHDIENSEHVTNKTVVCLSEFKKAEESAQFLLDQIENINLKFN